MRIKNVGISFELMRHLFAQGNVIPATKVISGIPADAVPCGCALLDGRTFQLTLESAEFPEVTEGDQIPWLDVTFETLQPVGRAAG